MLGKNSFAYPVGVVVMPSGRKVLADIDGYPLCFVHPCIPEEVWTSDEVRRMKIQNFPVMAGALGLSYSLSEREGVQCHPASGATPVFEDMPEGYGRTLAWYKANNPLDPEMPLLHEPKKLL